MIQCLISSKNKLCFQGSDYSRMVAQCLLSEEEITTEEEKEEEEEEQEAA